MRTLSIILLLTFGWNKWSLSQTDYAPVNDTISATSYSEALNSIFQHLPPSHYPSGFLFNKANPYYKLSYANGQLSDTSFNMLDFYFIQNFIRASSANTNIYPTYLKIDSLKNSYIDNHTILPWGIINISGHELKETAFSSGSLRMENKQLHENTTVISDIYTERRVFCVSPLNMDVNTLNPQFVFLPEYVYSNMSSTNPIIKMEVDLDDGIGFREVQVGVPFQASYLTGGYKFFVTRITHQSGAVYICRSELNVVNPDLLRLLNTTYKPYDMVYTIYGNGNNHSNSFGDYPAGEFSVNYDNHENDRYAEVGVWKACNNTTNYIRKPFLVFAGYNPKDGKSLVANGNAAWINNTFGAVLALDGWRGPLYETYNGFFTDASKNAGGGQNFGSNGNAILDKLRQEGYDVLIVRFHDGIGYLQTTAYLASLVIKDINYKIVNEVANITNPGAALDPEAPGYPNTTKVKRAKHELVVAGYSAGALASRMALTLMEYEHKVRNQCDALSARKSPHHRTRIWIGFDHEAQGSNTPLGQQMFMDFQQSLATFPANAADVANALICNTALNLLKTNGVATQNTLYNIDNTNNTGGVWSSAPHSDFTNYFNDLNTITLPTVRPELKGYPVKCYRIAISQGNANGIGQLLGGSTDLISNQSPSTWCVNPILGTAFGAGNWLVKITPFREAVARVISSWNNDAFDCRFGLNIRTLFNSWHINLGHWKYYRHNYVFDWTLGGNAKNYDEAPGSTLPSHLILAKGLPMSFSYPAAALTFCNLLDYAPNLHGFCPTVSGLDLHTPGNHTLPRFPNLALVPGNTAGGLNLMQQNQYNNGNNASPNGNYGYPHLTTPVNPYLYTPYDAIWANTTNNTNYDNNTIHVEDPNPEVGNFLAEEIAPSTLYLSNRLVEEDPITCGEDTYIPKYYADFEARNSILAGNQGIYN